MNKLLRLDKNNRWDMEGIELAIRERVGRPDSGASV
jgi:hypothetical protein